MDTREEIRIGINSKLWILSRIKRVEQRHIDGFIREILELEDKLGVVIKVDGELPEGMNRFEEAVVKGLLAEGCTYWESLVNK